MQSLGAQRRPLQHAEPVLLVDDDEPEIPERHVSRHQRMRADDEMDRAALDLGELLAPRRPGGRSGEQRDAEARRLQQPRDVAEMLLGEDFGWRHDRHLQAVLHRHQRRQQRDNRLAGADVPLQQPVHRLRLLQVVDDLLERLLLPVGQTEWQHPARRLANAIVDADRLRLLLRRGGVPPREHAHLEEKGFLEDQPALRRRCERVERLHREIGRREMRRHQRGHA